VEEEFTKADTNNDGVVSAEEFAAWAHANSSSEAPQPEEVAAVAASFEAIDSNHDGVLSKEEFENHFVTEAFLQVELANVMQAATRGAASCATSSLAGSATEQGTDGSMTVAEQLAAAAVAAVDAAVAAPPSTAAATEVSEDDAFALPPLVVSFAEMGATPTVVSIESAGERDAVVPVAEVARTAEMGATPTVVSIESAGDRGMAPVVEVKTPSASSGPDDAQELGAEIAAKDLVLDITADKESLPADVTNALKAATTGAASSVTGSVEGTIGTAAQGSDSKKVQQAVVAATFEAIDTNKDGVVSKEEFENFVARASEEPSHAEPVNQGPVPVEEAAEPGAPEAEDEDPEAIQERVHEVLEENSRLRSENMALRVELDALLAMAVTPEATPPGTAK